MSAVLVVDDHAIVRSGLRRLLKDWRGVEIVEAKSGEEAIVAVRKHLPDLVVLDLNLPALGGLELLRRVLRAQPGIRILVFSQHAEAIYATKALEAGARGFISKNATPDELLEAIDTVLAGGTAVEKAIQRDMALRKGMDDAYLRPLSQRDLDILRLLASGNTLSDIAKNLGIAYKTVANTLSRIKEKLGVSQTSDLIRIAVSRGLADLS